MISSHLIFSIPCIVVHNDTQDARFVIEIKEGIDIGGPLKYETAVKGHVGKLPPGCYDTIDGYLDPKSYVIKSYQDDKEIRRPEQKEREWIIENCRLQPEPEEIEQAQEKGDETNKDDEVAEQNAASSTQISRTSVAE